MAKSFRILIVDDQLRTRQSLKALLTTKFPEAEISEAANGIEALQLIGEFKPDVMVTDVVMPEMDGLTCTRLSKSTQPRIQVIVLTLYAEYQASALAAGADAFITKGQPPEELLTAVTNSTLKMEDRDEPAV